MTANSSEIEVLILNRIATLKLRPADVVRRNEQAQECGEGTSTVGSTLLRGAAGSAFMLLLQYNILSLTFSR